MNKTVERVRIVLSNMIKNPEEGTKKFNPNMFLLTEIEDKINLRFKLTLMLHSTPIAVVHISRKWSIDGIRTFSIHLRSGGHDTRTTSRYMNAVLDTFGHVPFFTCLRSGLLCLGEIGDIKYLSKGISFSEAFITSISTKGSDPAFKLSSLQIDGVDYYEIP